MRILALGGSIRAFRKDSGDSLLSIVRVKSHWAECIESLRSRPRLSNTEIAVSAALFGAREGGAEVDYYPLAQLFPRREERLFPSSANDYGLSSDLPFVDTQHLDKNELDELRRRVEAADGIILSSPVYFGDRSSVLQKFLDLSGSQRWLVEKPVASLSVGAKRNGGQETTNVFALWESLLQGGLVVGNGPESAQFGGTLIGGDRGDTHDDEEGLKTAMDTGRRLAQVTRLVQRASHSNQDNNHAARISVLVTSDDQSGRLENRVREIISRRSSQIRYNIVSLSQSELERCLACDICPIPDLLLTPETYACIIQNGRDGMESIRREITQADGIVLCGIEGEAAWDRYQIFIERSRFIRRNDFELTNLVATTFTLEEIATSRDQLFGLKGMTSLLRHNLLLSSPIREVYFDKARLRNGESAWIDFERRVSRVAHARKELRKTRVNYRAVGYRDRRLDETEALR